MLVYQRVIFHTGTPQVSSEIHCLVEGVDRPAQQVGRSIATQSVSSERLGNDNDSMGISES